MKIDANEVRRVLEESGPLTATQLADHLGLELTQKNRKEVLQKIRSAARKVVDTLGGKRTEHDYKTSELLYEVNSIE